MHFFMLGMSNLSVSPSYYIFRLYIMILVFVSSPLLFTLPLNSTVNDPNPLGLFKLFLIIGIYLLDAIVFSTA